MEYRARSTTDEPAQLSRDAAAVEAPGELMPRPALRPLTAAHAPSYLPDLPDLLALLLIAFVALLAHGLLHQPLLHSDDWPLVVERLLMDTAVPLDLANRRPLLYAPFLLVYRLFGLNLWAFTAVLLLLHAAGAFLIYKTAGAFGLRYGRLFGLLAALLYLVYPANYTHQWLIMLHVYTPVTLNLLALYLLTRYARAGGWWRYAAALALLLVSFGMYEMHLGLAALWSIFLAVYLRWGPVPARRRRWWTLLGPLLLLGLFAAWRSLGLQAAGIQDRYLGEAQRSPFEVAVRLLVGYRVLLLRSWLLGLERLLQSGASKPALAAALGGSMLLSGLTAWLLTGGWRNRPAGTRPLPPGLGPLPQGLGPLPEGVRPYLWAALLGLLMVGAGYIPVVTMYYPMLFGVDSRMHLLAQLGAAVLLASLALAAGILVSEREGGSGRTLAAGAVAGALLAPLLLLGLLVQMQIKRDHVATWHAQQAIWHDLLSQAPALADGTDLLLVVRGDAAGLAEEGWQRSPVAVWWEVSAAVRLLYGNRTLRGDLVFADVAVPNEPQLALAGIANADRDAPVPYARVVAFVYDPRLPPPLHLQRLWELPAAWVAGATEPIPLCGDCSAQAASPPPPPLRSLLPSALR
jgi:hypothetical protein